MDNYIALIAFSMVVLISHFFNLISRISRIPSVLLLIGFGIILKYGSAYFEVNSINLSSSLNLLGTIGLILIVLEGASDLKITRHNFPIVKGSFSAAAVIFLVSTSAIALLFHWWGKADYRAAFVNAIPLGVISSAISIPTVASFTKHKKEFLTYESIFSDILGITFFNFMIIPSVLNLACFTNVVSKLLIVIIISVAGSYLLLLSLRNMKTQTKFFIILSLLVLFYSVGQIFNLSSLLLVFTFGLLLNNSKNIRGFKISRSTDQDRIDRSLEQFKSIVSESAFLIRTFFFVIFGYSMDLRGLLDKNVFLIGTLIIIILLLVRFLYLKFILNAHVFPEIFIAPKGLVTIVLFYSIPGSLAIKSFNEGGVVFFVILVTGLLMLLSGFSKKHLKSRVKGDDQVVI
jgi:Kef-type K+ transport system membrane component KefB